MKDKDNKVFIIFCLCILLCFITIGFASFSSILNISSKVQFKSNLNTFKVEFSTDASKVVENDVVPIVSNGAIASNATINNVSEPTLSNLHISFSEPGQSVTYQFYMINSGDYDAFLNRIVTSNAVNDNGGYKVCTAVDGTSQTVVDAVCDYIEISITDSLGTSYSQGDFYIDNYKLPRGSSILIMVTINYNVPDSYNNGDFIVRFGDISFEFNSVDS